MSQLKRASLLEDWMKYPSRRLTPAKDEKVGLTDGHGLINLLKTSGSIILSILIKVKTLFTYKNDINFL